MKKADDVIMNASNVRIRNKIQLVKANINDNKNDNINDLSRKTGQYLTKKSLNRSLQSYQKTIKPSSSNTSETLTREVVSDDENIPERPIETDCLYDDSEMSD